MKNRSVIYLLSIPLLFFGFQCAKKKSNPVGIEYYAGQTIGSEHFITLYAAASDTFYQTPVSLADSPYLFAGNNADISARCLLRFPNIEPSGIVDSAKVLLHVSSLQPEPESPGELVVREVIQSWDEEIAPDGFTEAMLGNEIFRTIAVDTLLDTLFIPVSPETVETWRDTTEETNYGLHLSMDNDFMIQFYAYESAISTSATPQLWVWFHEDSTRSPLKVSYAEDVTFAKTTIPTASDRLVVENGTAVRSLLRFDLNAIPDHAAINKATLELTADTLSDNADLASVMTLNAFPLSDSLWTFVEMPFDTQYVADEGLLIEENAEIDMSVLVQLILGGYFENNGFMIRGGSESSTLTKAVFYSTEADSLRQPKLNIYYTVPPK